MKRRGKFDVVEYKNSWRVTGTKLNGERVRKNYPTEGEADAEKQRLEIEAANCGVQLRATRLTQPQLTDAEAAYRELGDTPLKVVIRFYKENYRDAFKPMILKDAFEKFIADKTAENARPDTITNLKRKNAFLLADYGERNVHEVLPEQVKALIYREGTKPVYQDNLRRAMGGFLNWCVEHGHCKESPLAKVKAIKSERDEPAVLPLSDVRKLLQHAASYKQGVVLPYVAISLFAGVRPKEIARLTWDDIDLGQKQITVSAKIAKLRGRRVIEITPNLVAWLKPYSIARRPLVGENWRRDFDAVKRMSGYNGRELVKLDDGTVLKPWTIDVMRHTAVSHHLAYHQHEGKTATWAGNSPDVIQKHYRRLVNPRDAKQFWKIAPDHSKGKSTLKLKSTLASSIQSISDVASAGKR